MRGKLILAIGLFLTGLGAAAWFGRDALKARYYVHKLTTVADDSWVGQAADWGDGVATRLVATLTRDDESICDRVGAASASFQSNQG